MDVVFPVVNGLHHRQQRGTCHQPLLYQRAAQLVGFFQGAFSGQDNPCLRVRFEHFVLPRPVYEVKPSLPITIFA